ncbi:hypothetical protein ABEB36_005133 [Hypothenemus hampei]|uniref:Alpha-and gamma-adaptin-binding protein p34 n=1 Tax=Hypothenemus hampei TaxID=57062 RepID=A0ABD1EX39_HYPHA
MDSMPSIVVVSSSSTKPKSIIKLITKENPSEEPCGLVKQQWTIDTKYYTASVNLLGIDETYQRHDVFNNKVEALLIHMDANKCSGLEDLQKWEQLEADCDPEIKLLLSNYCNDQTKITKNDAIMWCLKRGYEFIELYPSDEQNIEESTEENIILEKFGVDRIIEALQAHPWANLVMKNKNSAQRPPKIELNSSVSGNSNLPDELLGDDDFTELFSKLHMMKESLNYLPFSERSQCAEQLVTAFWKAIGGDEEELLE